MLKKSYLVTVLLPVAMSWGSLAQAFTDGTDRSVTLEKVEQTFVVQKDGSNRLNVDSVLLINEERAIKASAQRPVSYNRSLETLEVIEAYTHKPDGRKVMVDAAHIKEQQEQASAQAPMFQDSVNKVIIFPEVAVGDRIHAAAPPAVAAAGAALGDELFAAEGGRAVAAVAGVHLDAGFVKELHA